MIRFMVDDVDYALPC